MQLEKITWHVEDGVGVLTLHDIETRNALSSQLTREVVEVLTRANEDLAVKAIVLTGAGDTFCAGGHLGEFKQFLQMDTPTLYEDGLESTKLFQIRDIMQKPIIGAINGAALGGGTGLVALCHIAIGSEQTKLGLTELKLGLVPYVILPLVRRAVGDRRMLELMLSARIFSAAEAQQYGLLHEIVPQGEVLARAMEQAKLIAGYSPLAVKMALRSFEQTAEMGVSEAMSVLATMRLVSFQSADLKEGASAFLEKRNPVWQGR